METDDKPWEFGSLVESPFSMLKLWVTTLLASFSYAGNNIEICGDVETSTVFCQ